MRQARSHKIIKINFALSCTLNKRWFYRLCPLQFRLRSTCHIFPRRKVKRCIGRKTTLEMPLSGMRNNAKGLGMISWMKSKKALRKISKNPFLYPMVHRNTRRILIRRFLFAIYYLIEQESVIVIAVMHGSRHPKRWQYRT